MLQVQTYYFVFVVVLGDRYLTGSVHSLLHLPEAVRNLGPLWAHSCFGFESANGDLLKLFHGSQSVEKQVSCSAAQYSLAIIILYFSPLDSL